MLFQSIWPLLAASSAMTWKSGVASEHSRLREVDLDLALMGHKLPVDPDGEGGPRRIAGYFALNRTEAAEMFYFFFESRTDPSNDPVVLWMTGGPGCSSELAVFFENGPFTINKDLTLNDNPNGWDVSHNMIYVDQPIGTGYSYSTDPEDAVHDEKGVAHDMLDFLQEFMAAHPELAHNDFYVTGESYAGHYVPAVSHRVWKYNRAGEGQPIRLKGFAIGNGLTDPAVQYGAYADFALQNGLISQQQRDRIQSFFPHCKWAIDACNAHRWAIACEAALVYCQATIFAQIMAIAGDVNVYDIRKPCVGPLCYDFSLLADYLAQDHVRKALGVEGREFQECTPQVHNNFLADWMLDSAVVFPEMLDDGVRVMIYAGEEDLICNWLGNRRWVDALGWSGAPAWGAAQDCEWRVDGEAAGSFRQSGALSFVKVYKAGHMVPMDQGRNSLDMLLHLTRDKPFTCDGPAAAAAAAGAAAPSRPSHRRAAAGALSRGALVADGSA